MMGIQMERQETEYIERQRDKDGRHQGPAVTKGRSKGTVAPS